MAESSPDISADERPVGWGDGDGDSSAAAEDEDERLLADRPPHYDQA